MSEDPAPKTAKDWAKDLAVLRKRPLFVWCDEGGRSIDDSCVWRLRGAFTRIGRFPEMDLLIQSPGGDMHSAYRALRILRHHADRITALVPWWAKSAATFLALGADEILMGRYGELGPLDMQMRDLRGSVRWLSALNEFKSLEYIREYATETLDLTTTVIAERFVIDYPYALEHAKSIINAFTAPLYSQVRPQDLGQYRRSLQVGEDYARRVMQRWGYAKKPADAVDKMVRRLVWEYPAHEFVIDLDEAQDIGLAARRMDESAELLAQLIAWSNEVMFELVIPPSVDGGEPASDDATIKEPEGGRENEPSIPTHREAEGSGGSTESE